MADNFGTITAFSISPAKNYCMVSDSSDRLSFYAIKPKNISPVLVTSIMSPCTCLEVDWNSGLIVTASASKETVGVWKIKPGKGEDFELIQMLSAKVCKQISAIGLMRQRNEVLFGTKNGNVWVLPLGSDTPKAIRRRETHQTPSKHTTSQSAKSSSCLSAASSSLRLQTKSSASGKCLGCG